MQKQVITQVQLAPPQKVKTLQIYQQIRVSINGVVRTLLVPTTYNNKNTHHKITYKSSSGQILTFLVAANGPVITRTVENMKALYQPVIQQAHQSRNLNAAGDSTLHPAIAQNAIDTVVGIGARPDSPDIIEEGVDDNWRDWDDENVAIDADSDVEEVMATDYVSVNSSSLSHSTEVDCDSGHDSPIPGLMETTADSAKTTEDCTHRSVNTSVPPTQYHPIIDSHNISAPVSTVVNSNIVSSSSNNENTFNTGSVSKTSFHSTSVPPRDTVAPNGENRLNSPLKEIQIGSVRSLTLAMPNLLMDEQRNADRIETPESLISSVSSKHRGSRHSRSSFEGEEFSSTASIDSTSARSLLAKSRALKRNKIKDCFVRVKRLKISTDKSVNLLTTQCISMKEKRRIYGSYSMLQTMINVQNCIDYVARFGPSPSTTNSIGTTSKKSLPRSARHRTVRNSENVAPVTASSAEKTTALPVAVSKTLDTMKSGTTGGSNKFYLVKTNQGHFLVPMTRQVSTTTTTQPSVSQAEMLKAQVTAMISGKHSVLNTTAVATTSIGNSTNAVFASGSRGMTSLLASSNSVPTTALQNGGNLASVPPSVSSVAVPRVSSAVVYTSNIVTSTRLVASTQIQQSPVHVVASQSPALSSVYNNTSAPQNVRRLETESGESALQERIRKLKEKRKQLESEADAFTQKTLSLDSGV